MSQLNIMSLKINFILSQVLKSMFILKMKIICFNESTIFLFILKSVLVIY